MVKNQRGKNYINGWNIKLSLFAIFCGLIFVFVAFLSNKSVKIYKYSNPIERKLKESIFRKRTNFILFVAILSIAILLVYRVIIGIYFEYVFLMFSLSFIVFDITDSVNKIDILKKNNFSLSFIDDFRLYTKYNAICSILLFILFFLGIIFDKF